MIRDSLGRSRWRGDLGLGLRPREANSLKDVGEGLALASGDYVEELVAGDEAVLGFPMALETKLDKVLAGVGSPEAPWSDVVGLAFSLSSAEFASLLSHGLDGLP